MNINPISFGKVLRIESNNPKKSAQEIKKFINREADGCATVESFYNDSAFILTGKEAAQLHNLRLEKAARINAAIDTYGEESGMVELVRISEQDRYIDLAKCIVGEANVSTLGVEYDEEKEKIESIYIYN